MDLYKQQMLKEWLSEIWLVSIKDRWGQKKNGKRIQARTGLNFFFQALFLLLL